MMRTLIFCAVLFMSIPVLADPPVKRQLRVAQNAAVRCTVRCIHAHQRPGGIDRRLAFLSKQLKRPPFSAFKSFQLLTARDLTIPQKAAAKEARLPTKKVLRLAFREKLLDGKKIKLRMLLTIKPKIKTVFTIRDRGTMLLAGTKYKRGTLVVGITCSAR